MYTNLFFVEGWVKDLAKEVEGLIYARPYRLNVTEFGECYIYDEIILFKSQSFIDQYALKALSILSKLDVYRDDVLLNNLRNELRDGQFDDQRTQSLNRYAAKVLRLFIELWLVGFEFEKFYCYDLPNHIKDNETYDDGVRYYYENEDLELGNVLYRIRSFFKYSSSGYKADTDEYTVESVLSEYADFPESETYIHEAEPTKVSIKLRWNGAADTLYDVFRQLKNHHLPKGETLIDDSYDQIARFIQQTFVGFDEVETSTIRGKLTKSERPKKSFNRLDLDLTKPD